MVVCCSHDYSRVSSLWRTTHVRSEGITVTFKISSVVSWPNALQHGEFKENSVRAHNWNKMVYIHPNICTERLTNIYACAQMHYRNKPSTSIHTGLNQNQIHANTSQFLPPKCETLTEVEPTHRSWVLAAHCEFAWSDNSLSLQSL